MFDITKLKIESARLTDFDVDRTPGKENVRDLAAYSIDRLNDLQESLILQGQTDPILVYRDKSGKLKIVRGFRRFTGLEALAKNGAVFEGGQFAGKPVEMARVQILPDNISEAERIALMFDHGQREGLNATELQRAVEMSIRAGETERTSIVLFSPLFEMFYPPKKELVPVSVDGGKQRHEYYKGTFQTIKAAFDAPDVLHELWMRKLSGDPSAKIRKADMVTLSGIHVKEAKKDKTGNISKSNPGPEFLAKWNALLEAYAKAAETGNAPKPSISMRNREQTENAVKNCNSRILKIAYRIQLGEIAFDEMAKLDAALVSLQKGEATYADIVPVLDAITADAPATDVVTDVPAEPTADPKAE